MIGKILLTGAAGKLGRRLRAPLSLLCRELIATDIVPLTPVAPNEVVVQCDLADPAVVEKLLKDVDVIVHFAGYPREADWSTIIAANIISVTNLWEAAQKQGVQRIVYASTNHVVGMHSVAAHIDVNAELKCDSRYGVSKAFTETLARFYYEKYGLQSLGIRIGRCEERATDARMLSTWIHPDDLTTFVKLGIEHPGAAEVVYGISANSKAWCKNPPHDLFPYTPKHSADTFAEEIAKRSGSQEAVWAFQGGPFASHEYVGNKARAADFYRSTFAATKRERN